MNGLELVVMGTMALLCYQAAAAGMLGLVHVRAGIKSVSACLLFLAVVLWTIIWKKKRIQKLFWRVSDLVGILVPVCFVGILTVHIFSVNLCLQYPGADPAAYFAEALEVLRTGTLPKMYFSALTEALVMEVLSPALSGAFYVKSFVFADICMHVLEACMFYVLILMVSEKKIVRFLAPVFSVAYFFGYPAYSYMNGGFVTWSNGIMIGMLLIYALLLLEKDSYLYGGCLLLLGLLANICCEALLAPVNTAVCGAALLVLLIRRRKRLGSGRVFLCACAIFGLALLAAVLLYWRDRGYLLEQAAAGTVGGSEVYGAVYADVIFFLPALFYVAYYVFFRKKSPQIIGIVSIGMVLGTVSLYVGWYNGLLSNYSYYKIYYSLWLSGWLLAAVALDIASETGERAQYFSYMGFLVFLGVLVFSDYDAKMLNNGYAPDGPYATKNFFSLYRQNVGSLNQDYKTYRVPDEVLEIYGFVTEECGEENIPILTTDLNERLWYDVLTANASETYSLAEMDFPELVKALGANGIQQVVVQKNSEVYRTYGKYFELCPTTHENEAAALCTIPGDTWLDICDEENMEDYAGRLELYSYVEEELEGEAVPLMAGQASYLDFIFYQNLTGYDSTEFYTWKFSELDSILNLNKHGVHYIILLNGDDYYKRNHVYYDKREIVFENEVGKVVRCEEEGWTTTY